MPDSVVYQWLLFFSSKLSGDQHLARWQKIARDLAIKQHKYDILPVASTRVDSELEKMMQEISTNETDFAVENPVFGPMIKDNLFIADMPVSAVSDVTIFLCEDIQILDESLRPRKEEEPDVAKMVVRKKRKTPVKAVEEKKKACVLQ